MNLTDKDIDRILKIVDESGYDEVSLEVGDFKLHVRRACAGSDPGFAPAAPAPMLDAAAPAAGVKPAAAALAPKPPQPEAVPEGLVAVRSPMLGTFYRTPSPGAKPFVEVGDRVSADDTVCLVEVMKLFNSVSAGVDGIIVQILAENGALVEFGQVLMLIEHSLVDASGQTE